MPVHKPSDKDAQIKKDTAVLRKDYAAGLLSQGHIERQDFATNRESEAPACTAHQIPADSKRRCLLIRGEVLSRLHLTDEQVQGLINTRQIIPIRIAGEERFDSRDLDQFIESYKSTASRRP